MSAKIMGQVWDLKLPHDEMLILLAMADHAEHDGSHVFPSQALIAWKTGYSIRQVSRIQTRLQERKILIRTGNGWRGTQHFRIDLSIAPRKPEWARPDKMTIDKMTIDKMTIVEKPNVTKSLHQTIDKMTIDKMTIDNSTIDKMTIDILDTSIDISDTSHNKDARAEPSLEPSVRQKIEDTTPKIKDTTPTPTPSPSLTDEGHEGKPSRQRTTRSSDVIPPWSDDLPWPNPISLVSLYNAMKPDGWSMVESVAGSRLRKCEKYLKDYPKKDWWLKVMENLPRWTWLQNRLRRESKNFDWLVKEGRDEKDNCLKVQEGHFLETKTPTSTAQWYHDGDITSDGTMFSDVAT